MALTLTTLATASDLPFSRAMYGKWNTSQLARVGFDAILARIPRWDGGRGENDIEDMVRELSAQATDDGVEIILIQHYECKRDVPFDYTRAVNEYGQEETRVPSPVDKEYWRKHIEAFALFAANLSLCHHIWGIAWDMELYHDSDQWRSYSYSYDRDALVEFANSTNRTFPEIPPAQTHRFLEEMGILAEYKKWQEGVVFDLASETAKKVQAINPNLSLGILAVSDSWVRWKVLGGLNSSIPSTPPLTAWSEDTYGGYDTLDYKNRKEWWAREAEGLNAVLIPGFWTVKLGPFDLIENMDSAARDEGVMWVYQKHDPFQQADEDSYVKAYQILHSWIFFNRSEASPLPPATLFPGIDARPYAGPENATVFLETHHLSDAISEEVGIDINTTGISYFGENLTVKQISPSDLRCTDLPCILQGLEWPDLLACEIQGLITELKLLGKWAGRIGIEIGQDGEILEVGREHLAKGEYEDARSVLSAGLDGAYDATFDQIVPLLEEPPPDLRPAPAGADMKIRIGERLLSEMSDREARLYLMAGLKNWAIEVGEGFTFILIPVLIILFRNQTLCNLISPRGQDRRRERVLSPG